MSNLLLGAAVVCTALVTVSAQNTNKNPVVDIPPETVAAIQFCTDHPRGGLSPRREITNREAIHEMMRWFAAATPGRCRTANWESLESAYMLVGSNGFPIVILDQSDLTAPASVVPYSVARKSGRPARGDRLLHDPLTLLLPPISTNLLHMMNTTWKRLPEPLNVPKDRR